MDRQGKKLVHTNVKHNDFEFFLKLVAPYRQSVKYLEMPITTNNSIKVNPLSTRGFLVMVVSTIHGELAHAERRTEPWRPDEIPDTGGAIPQWDLRVSIGSSAWFARFILLFLRSNAG